MEEAEYYDEFGNYIGPNEGAVEAELEDNDFEGGDIILNGYEDSRSGNMQISAKSNTTVVLHEDKKFFPSAMEVYGESVQVLVEEEDAQPLTEPIIAPIKEILIDTAEGSIPELKYPLE